MRKIINTLDYEGGAIRPFILYTASKEPMIVSGKVHFRIFGEVTMNGVQLDHNETRLTFERNVEFKIGKKSGILFYDAPRLARVLDEPIDLPHPPDMQDEMTRQMHMLFDSWVKERGLSPQSPVVDDQEYDDNEDWEDMDELPELDPTGFEEDDIPPPDIPEGPETNGEENAENGEDVPNGEVDEININNESVLEEK